MNRFKLSSWQRQRLRRQLGEATDVRLYRRTLAVLEFAGGRPAAEIACMLGVTRQSVYHWVDAYAAAHDPVSRTRAGSCTRRKSGTEKTSHHTATERNASRAGSVDCASLRLSPCGSAAWQEQTAERLGLQSTFRAPGRPRKQTGKARQ